MQLPAFSTDIIIILGAALVIGYGMLRGQGALIREAISTYVGLVLAATFGEPLYDYLQQQAGGGYGATQSMVQMVLLVLPIIILQFASHSPHMRHRTSHVITFILAVLTSMFLISSFLTQLSPSELKAVTDESNLATQIHRLHLIWLALVPAAIAVSAVFKPKEKHH